MSRDEADFLLTVLQAHDLREKLQVLHDWLRAAEWGGSAGTMHWALLQASLRTTSPIQAQNGRYVLAGYQLLPLAVVGSNHHLAVRYGFGDRGLRNERVVNAR